MPDELPQRRRPRGRARMWTDAEIEEFLERADAEDADRTAEEAGRQVDALWRAGVLLAVLGVTRRRRGQSTIRWNTATQRYVTQTAHLVKRVAVRNAVDAVKKVTAQQVKRLGEQLQAGRVTIGEFQILARDALIRGHLVSGAIAQGGRAQLNETVKGAIIKLTKPDYKLLARLAHDVETAKIPVSGRFFQRLRQIAFATRSTYFETEQVVKAATGFKEARRVLSNSEHCVTTGDRPGCAELAGAGWVDIDDLVPIGEAACWDNCLCDVVYR